MPWARGRSRGRVSVCVFGKERQVALVASALGATDKALCKPRNLQGTEIKEWL